VAVLLFLYLPAMQARGDNFWWLEDEDKDNSEVSAKVEGPEIKEPFFAFIIALAEGDSIGTWSSAVIAERIKEFGEESLFPIEKLSSITRRAAVGQEQESRMYHAVSRIWEMEMGEDLDRSMPYSILGYHPGSLRISKKLVFSEWRLGHLNLLVTRKDEPGELTPLDSVMILRLDEGSIVLDVDRWLDALLGSGLDDSWTLGMAIARNDSVPMGLAISLGREGRRIFGEIDFQADKVKAHGSPLARALSRHGRIFTAPHPYSTNIPWAGEN
jgi:hypothetical protein